ncbi:MAG: trypsin-like peptidase domain-containing protein [bacterium]
MRIQWIVVAVLLLSLPGFAAAPVPPERRSAVVRAVEKAGPAVVNVSTARIVRRSIDPFFEFRDRFFDDTFREFFRRHSRPYVQNSLGSGVIISPDGYILTNAHVVTRATKIKVSLADKSQYEAELLNVDSDVDIALLKIEPEKKLPVAPIATSADLMIGETVIAIGNPFGLQNTVTTGVISATDRSIRAHGREVFKNLLQTDAAINPGNSGGALLNIRGELIGINTAIQAGAEGIGFAIPIDGALASACDLIDYRLLKRIRIGVELEKKEGGTVIVNVEPASPAAAAGLKPGDRIVSVDDRAVSSIFCFRRLIVRRDPGDTVKLGVRRGEKVLSVELTLGRIPEPSPVELAKKKLGLDVQDLTEELGEALGLKEEAGILISGVEKKSPAAATGLRPSDVIVHVGRHRVKNVRQLGMLLKDLDAGQQAGLLIVRNRRLYRAVIRAR